MFICICKAVTDEEIRKCITRGAKTVEDVQEKTKAGTQCGGCIEEVQEVLNEKLSK